MPNLLATLFDPASFTPHGFCLSWEPGLLWLHGVSDVVIGLSYFSIPLVLLQFARRRADLEYRWVLWLFALFILACGTTHFLSVVTLWRPLYWLDGMVKLLTALVSVATAALLWPLLPRLLALPSPAALQLVNDQLSWQMQERERHVAALQEQDTALRHLQRMEALGKLSAGVAHDFNNVLQAISAGLHTIRRRADAPEKVRELADMTAAAVARGAAVAGRLLAIGRKAPLRAEAVAPDELLHGLKDILVAGLSPAIQVRTEIDPATPPMLADRAQVETILLNLASNAQDAMQAGGTLTLSAHADTVPAPQTDPARPPPGQYVRIAVTDTGHGMPPEILARIGEPFFTTKPIGAGTGLGVAMARAFAEQSGGGFAIASEPGLGTTVTLWFPAATLGPDIAEPPEVGSPADRAGHRAAHIVVVDDDAMVRDVLAGELQDLGFHVTTMPEGAAALAHLRANAHPDLLITDYAMPGMNGLELIEAVTSLDAGLPIILLTGHAEPVALARLAEIVDHRIVLLRKPISGETLADRATQLLRERETS